MQNILVFFGGRSNASEISIITGMFAYNLLKSGCYNAVPVYIGNDGVFYTNAHMNSVEYFRAYIPQKKDAVALFKGCLVRADKPKKVLLKADCALNCCHGGMGEDGTLSALLRFHGIKSASPDTAPSAVFMDKTFSKFAAKGLGIPVLPSLTLKEGEGTDTLKELGYPVILKPARLGSSIGIKVVNSEEELAAALAYAFRLDNIVLAEKYLQKKSDINCAAYRKNGEVVVSDCEEVFSDSEILTFSEKYEGTGERHSTFPAAIPKETSDKIKEYVKTIYTAFRIRGVVRADFLLAGKEVYFNELNTVPGSLASYLFGEKLTECRAFVCRLTEEALLQTEAEKEVVSSGILNGNVFAGRKVKR